MRYLRSGLLWYGAAPGHEAFAQVINATKAIAAGPVPRGLLYPAAEFARSVEDRAEVLRPLGIRAALLVFQLFQRVPARAQDKHAFRALGAQCFCKMFALSFSICRGPKYQNTCKIPKFISG